LAVLELGQIWKLFAGEKPTRRSKMALKLIIRNHMDHFMTSYEALLPIFGPEGVAGIDRDIRDTCRVMDNNPDQKPPSYIHMRRPSLKV
jgi:hypothetical protein